MQQNSHGLSYWPVRRQIRQHVAAAMTTFDAAANVNNDSELCFQRLGSKTTMYSESLDFEHDDTHMLSDLDESNADVDQDDTQFHEFRDTSSDGDDDDSDLQNDSGDSIGDLLVAWVAKFNISLK